MPSYPAINDKEFNLLKKIAENTAEISAGGGGGGGAAVWGGIIGVLSAQTDLNAALNLRAPKASPHFTGAVQFDVGSIFIHKTGFGDIAFIDESGLVLSTPLIEQGRVVTDSDSPIILVTDNIINYQRTDSEPLTAPSPGDVGNGQHLTITNSSVSTVSIDGSDPNSFYVGQDGIVSSIDLQASETISFIALGDGVGSQWRVVSRFLASSQISADYINANFNVNAQGGVNAFGFLNVGNVGAQINRIFTFLGTLDFGSILAGASADLTIAASGVLVGDSVHLGLPAAPNASCVFEAFVSASNVVTVRAHNVGAIAADPASATYRVTVMQFETE